MYVFPSISAALVSYTQPVVETPQPAMGTLRLYRPLSCSPLYFLFHPQRPQCSDHITQTRTSARLKPGHLLPKL